MRGFQEKWTLQYFFVEFKNKPLCLICNESVSVMKEYNVKRHQSKHSAKYDTLEGSYRSDKVNHLKENVKTQQSIFSKTNKQAENSVKISYVIAEKIAKRGKPFTDGEFVKDCIQSIIEIICPAQSREISKVSLSGQTVACRIEDLSTDIFETFQHKCNNFVFYSVVAMDESTDSSDTAQVAIFIRGINENFEIVEELAALVGLKDCTKAANLYTALINTLKKCNLSVKNMSVLTTDGAPTMIGKRGGVAALIKQDAEANENMNFSTFHCILHQQVLCTKVLSGLQHVMAVIVRIVNYIKSNSLNHRQFQTLLDELETEFGDVVYYCEVRWLSRANMLKRVFALRKEIEIFMKSKGKPVQEFQSIEWMRDFAFLVNITGHLNQLNTRLQGKDQLVHNLYDSVKGFQAKLMLWQNQLNSHNYVHFPTLAGLAGTNAEYSEKYVKCILNLIEEFDCRFGEFKEKEILLKIFSSPFSLEIDLLPSNLQLEVADLQNDSTLKDKFLGSSLVDFYSKYVSPTKYPEVRKNALFMLSMFGSTYLCEQLFSRMKHVKSRIRTRITDAHLEGCLQIAITDIKPDIDKLVQQKMCQISHY